jgi:hypothetical protein
MAARVQVILDEEEATRFRARARRESKSLSAWLRDAGRKALRESEQTGGLKNPAALRKFFRESNKLEKGKEPDWEEHKRIILEGYSGSDL